MTTPSDPLRGLRPQIMVRHWQTGRKADTAAACASLAHDSSAQPEELFAAVEAVLQHDMVPAYDAALVCAQRILAQTPNAGVYRAIAHFQWVSGRTADAIAALRTAIQLEPGQSRAWYRLGLMELEDGNPFDAVRSSSVALGLEPPAPGARLVREIALRLLTNRPVVDVAFAGTTLRFRLSGKTFTVDSSHITGHINEEAELLALTALPGPWRCIVDIGGNVGNHAVVFHRLLRPARLVVYEVNPRCLPILSANLALNQTPGSEYEVRPRAIGAAKGRLFLPYHDDLNTGLEETGTGPGETVEVVPLDDEVAAADLIKIDVEGMELEVLRGAARIIRESAPWLLIEVQEGNHTAFEEWMQSQDYCVARSFEHSGYRNLLAGPKARVLALG